MSLEIFKSFIKEKWKKIADKVRALLKQLLERTEGMTQTLVGEQEILAAVARCVVLLQQNETLNYRSKLLNDFVKNFQNDEDIRSLEEIKVLLHEVKTFPDSVLTLLQYCKDYGLKNLDKLEDAIYGED